MSLSSAKVNQLNDIYHLLYHDDTTFQDFVEGNGGSKKLARQEMTNWIKNKLQQVGYNGRNNVDNIYWFSKGLNLPPPTPPKRYDQTDNYILRSIKRRVLNSRRSKDDSTTKLRRIDFKTFSKTFAQTDQERIVNQIKEELEKTPSDWCINFDLLNDYGKRLLFPILED